MQEVSKALNQSRDMLRISQILETVAYDSRFLVTVGECVEIWRIFESGIPLSSQQEAELSAKMVDVMTVLLSRIVRSTNNLTFKGGV